MHNNKGTEEPYNEEPIVDLKVIGQTKSIIFQGIPNNPECEVFFSRMESKVAETVEAPTILFIPGIEGFTKIMQPLSKNLEAHVYGLQFDYTRRFETIYDIAMMKLLVSGYFDFIFKSI